MLIEDLPEDLKKLALKRQLEENDFIDERANLCNTEDAFTWESTPEGGSFWKLVDEGLFTEAWESLIGRSIKGFKFESVPLSYHPEMDKCIDRIGLIEEVDDGSIRVSFYDGADSWWYPMRQALDHLVPEGSIDQGTKELHRTSPDGKSEGIHEKPLTPEECVSVEAGEKQRVFETGSKRDDSSNKPRVADLKAYTRLRFGWHMLLGAKKYGEGNFELGQPDKSTLESMHRHLAMYELGDRSEDHLSALLFGIQLLMQNEQREGVEPDHFYKLNK